MYRSFYDMLFYRVLFLILFFIGFSNTSFSQAPSKFVITDNNSKVSLIFDSRESSVVEIAVNALADDILRLTGSRPVVANNMSNVTGNVIIVGTKEQSRFLKNDVIPASQVPVGWETYSYTFVENYTESIPLAMVICGADKRGAAYGVFDLSKKLGVSPWYWWADVVPGKKDQLTVNPQDFLSQEPSVKFRGIFLNDECWGLNPWASNTYEPEEGNIGPRTYARIFELLLRLKANFIWPAMHPCTNAFYKNPENPKVADEYGIVVGTSHAEPMLRNNVDEWNHHSMGDYNYMENRETVLKYWDERVKESLNHESFYTLGMRGIHDSGMVGVGSREEQVKVLEKIISEQRKMLKKHINSDVTEIPQTFTAYKEVLDIYDAGLQLPEDITLVWPDDNYGYIKRFSNESEMQRAGGSGIYYHLSYWGRPHDYLWLSSTHPSLIREEMMKAAHYKSREIWVANVGDIKPAEYNMSLFLDMAFNNEKFENPLSEKKHLEEWMISIFGTGTGEEAAAILWNYYQLNFERRPEFMGWSQTEPTRKTHFTAFSLFENGDELQKRIDAFDELSQKVRELRGHIPERLDDAFFQLVWYPVICAGYINKKFLYTQKAYKYASQGRSSANDFARKAQDAYENILSETKDYNNQLLNGKWKNMMDFAPRSLPVFNPPTKVYWDMTKEEGWAIATEGNEEIRRSKDIYGPLSLPEFTNLTHQSYFADVLLKGLDSLQWEVIPSENWIAVNKSSGVLSGDFGDKQERVWISVDWSQFPEKDRSRGKVTLKGDDGKEISFNVYAKKYQVEKEGDGNLFVENNGYFSIYGENYSRVNNGGPVEWDILEGLGYTGSSVWVNPMKSFTSTDVVENASVVEYELWVDQRCEITVHIYCLPVHPLTKGHDVRIGVGLNEEKPQVISHKTYGRSETWKQNVLSNSAKVTCRFIVQEEGLNTLKIYAIDPGVIIDRIEIDTGGLPNHYSVLPETRCIPVVCGN
ncbi:glycosyl hydrolase 115 family protein [Marinilabilia salmonicolor]|uniref:Glycosyl hydrolase family 115 (Putative glucuronidase) n=1 Tax=Marinilabilia salmonicolor TaxID=989 RepID=A0A368UUN3_9BACT|nr:glycosyl hydrolase 115 family protein [Marinilabilia salmonicolor]RCW32549.1 glycosyl hydrolase family 115 (putative glucuronidase) [Marinilabilia salmonicolor]